MNAHLDDVISAYADGELTGDEAATAEAHLTACPSCRAELSATRQAKAWLSDLPEVDAAVRVLRAHAARPVGDASGAPGPPVDPRRAISLAATASIWLAVVGMSGLDANRPSGLPALNSLVSLHQRTPQRTASGPAIRVRMRRRRSGPRRSASRQ